ncbi:MAG: hypothetical protein ACYSW8_27925, partial [Planctomycetota bacterium]
SRTHTPWGKFYREKKMSKVKFGRYVECRVPAMDIGIAWSEAKKIGESFAELMEQIGLDSSTKETVITAIVKVPAIGDFEVWRIYELRED